MAIKITRNDAGNCINFVGSTNPAYWNACLSGAIDSVYPNRINVVNDIRTGDSVTDIYEFYRVPFGDFTEKDGTAFATAQACIDYINQQCNVVGDTGKFLLTPADFLDFELESTGTHILLDNGSNYGINTIKAVAEGTQINIITHTPNIIIYRYCEVANLSISGVPVSSVLNTAVDQLNGLFTNTVGFSASDVSVSSGLVSGNLLTFTMSDGAVFSVDVTSLATDTDTTVNTIALSQDFNTLTATLSDGNTVNADVTALAIDTDTVPTSFTLSLDFNTLTLTMSDLTVHTVDVTSHNLDEDTVLIGAALSNGNNTLTLTNSDLTTVVVDTTSLAIDTTVTLVSGVIAGTDLVLTYSDSSSATIDMTDLLVDVNNEVVSGAVSGTDLVLTMDDGSVVTIDVISLQSGEALPQDAPAMSAQSVTVGEGDLFNFLLEVDSGSSIATIWKFTSLPSWAIGNQSTGAITGTATVYLGTPGSGTPDVYTLTALAGNPFGISSAVTITINVTEASLTTDHNTGNTSDGVAEYWKQNKNQNFRAPMYRAGTTGNAWSITSIFKRTSTDTGMVWSYAAGTGSNSPEVSLQQNSDGTKTFIYGTSFNRIFFDLPAQSVGDWESLTITYDGGTTGASSGSLASYYSRFKFYTTDTTTRVATLLSPTGQHLNYGFTGQISGAKLYIGSKFGANNELEGIWDYLGLVKGVVAIGDIGGAGFALDPTQYIADNTITDAEENKIWLFGDGSTDVFNNIFNQVNITDGPSKLASFGNVASDVVSISIPGL